MTFPVLPDPRPEGQIDSMRAYRLIAQHGVVSTEPWPACEHIRLGGGLQITLWYGGDDIPAYWTLDR